MPVRRPTSRPSAARRGAVVAAVAGVAGTAALVPLAAPADAATSGLPVRWAKLGPGVHRSSPTLGDLSVGRVVLGGDMDGWLTATRGDGTVAWRAPVDPRPGMRTAVESSPSVGDLDGDGSNEVLVAGGALGSYVQQDGGVVAYRGDGSVLWRWRSPDRFGPGGPRDGWGDGIYASPAIGDVNGDGRPDVSFGGWDQNVWSLDGATGRPLAGFPFENTDTVWSTPALSDTNGDGVLDIIIGGDQSGNPAVPGTYNGGVLRVLTATGGRVTERYRVNVPDIVASSPAVGDIEGTGRLAAVFAVGDYWRPADSRRVFAVHLDDGSPVAGWPRSTGAPGFGSVALGDVVPGDGGRPEVVVADTANTMYAWRGDGTLAWSRPQAGPGVPQYGGPSIGDVDGDGDQDVAIGYGFGGALLLDGRSGALLGQAGGAPFASEATPLFADFGGSTGRRLVLAGWNPAVGAFGSGQLAAYALPASSAQDAWPMFHKDAAHRGGGSIPPMVHGAIAVRYDALGGSDGFLGRPLTPELGTPGRVGRYNHFAGGSIYWSPATGAHEVHGSIRDHWAALGWESGVLGFPVTDEQAVPTGAVQRFERGWMSWSSATGAFEVHGAIGDTWQRSGAAGGPLGHATTDETRTPRRPGAYNHFTGGSVYWSPGTGAHAVLGPVRAAWARLGWEDGVLGFPTTDPIGLTGGTFSRFERGQVYWSGETGAHEVHGAIFGAWGATGWENGPLGYPTTDETATPGVAGAFNHFRGGSVYWSPTTGAHAVLGPLREAWAASGWERGCLGFPTADETTATPGGVTTRTAVFQRGTISWTAAGGARVSCS